MSMSFLPMALILLLEVTFKKVTWSFKNANSQLVENLKLVQDTITIVQYRLVILEVCLVIYKCIGI